MGELADKNRGVAVLIGLFLGPLGYVYTEQWHWAVICLLTLNYALLGIVFVPVHVWLSIGKARSTRSTVEDRAVATG